MVGSGIAIMSDSSIGLKPVIEEPSKPMPPSNASSSSDALIEKLFSWPSRSVNQSRTKRTSLGLAEGEDRPWLCRASRHTEAEAG